jgi:adenosylcobinamide-GDP ribazoletransferase
VEQSDKGRMTEDGRPTKAERRRTNVVDVVRPPSSVLRHPSTSLLIALGFLTIIPVRTSAPEPGDLGRAGRWFPIIGLVLGVILAAAHFLLGQLFSPLLTAALVVVLWAALTGGLHLDGLADCCDGLFAAVSAERRLEIMRDPRLGAFGGLGLILFIILKILAIASLPSSSFVLGIWGLSPSLRFGDLREVGSLPLVLAASLSRYLILLVARQPSVRPGGLGADFALGLTPKVFILAALIPLALILLGGWRALTAAALAHLVAFVIIRFSRARLGGVTGDVLGLTVELAELTVLLTFAASF